jgi:hypothetical protein
MLVTRETIASSKSRSTQATVQTITQLLNYAVAHSDAIIRYTTIDMYLHIHSDASYLFKVHTKIHTDGTFFLSSNSSYPTMTPPPTNRPQLHNGAIHTISSMLRDIMASATESALTTLFHNAHNAHDAPLAPPSLKWDIHKAPHPSKPTMHVPPASPTKQLSNADPKQSACIFTGSETESNKANS